MAKAVTSSKKGGLKKATKPAAANKRPAAAVRKSVSEKKAPAKKTTAIKKGAKTSPKKAAGRPASKKGSKDMTRYRCRLCGYIYSPFRGEPHNGIPAGTAFEDLPDTYVCPICGQQGKGKIGKWGFEEWRPTRYSVPCAITSMTKAAVSPTGE